MMSVVRGVRGGGEEWGRGGGGVPVIQAFVPGL